MKENHREQQKLPCKLSQSDIDRKTEELVRLEQEEAAKKAEKKATVAERNAQLKQTRASIDQRVKELSDGSELRDVDVEVRFDFKAKVVRYVRLDTGEEVQRRDMDSFDLQENMHYEGDLLPPPSHVTPKTGDAKDDEESEDEEPAPKSNKVISIAERRAREAKSSSPKPPKPPSTPPKKKGPTKPKRGKKR